MAETYVPTEKATALVDQIVDVVVEVVAASGENGAPAGVLYSRLMAPPFNLNLASFEMLMLIGVKKGKLVKKGQLYFAA